jgi:leucyl-tRNA synthetase
LYSRFWNKALFDLGLVKDSEPYAGRRNRGLILGPDGNKMSKSKGNVIDPDELVRNVGADTVRMYLAFMGPYGVADSYPWDPNGFVGIRRFLERVWNLKEKISEESNLNLDKTIKKLEDDIERLKFNTAISGMMIFVNQVEEQKSITKENYKKLLQILAPFAPHMTEEIWRELGEQESIHLSTWPSYDESKIRDEHVKIIIQINGKVRGEIDASLDEGEETVKERALAAVREKIGESPIKKVIYVPGRIVNIVI